MAHRNPNNDPDKPKPRREPPAKPVPVSAPGADRQGRGPETGPDNEMEAEVKPPGRVSAS